MILKENPKSNSLSITKKGGLYYALWKRAIGYEFYEDSVGGVTFDVTYSHYTSSILRSESVRQQSFSKLVYEKFNELLKTNLGITMGFKFKL